MKAKPEFSNYLKINNSTLDVPDCKSLYLRNCRIKVVNVLQIYRPFLTLSETYYSKPISKPKVESPYFSDPAGKTRSALIGVLLKEAQKAKRKVEWSETDKS